jgi:hypothetical protein
VKSSEKQKKKLVGETGAGPDKKVLLQSHADRQTDRQTDRWVDEVVGCVR